jgi:hypothetical protein
MWREVSHVGTTGQRNERRGYAGDDARMVELLEAFLVHYGGGRRRTRTRTIWRMSLEEKET